SPVARVTGLPQALARSDNSGPSGGPGMPAGVVAIDQGTTSTRCIVFTEERAVATAQKEHRQIYPQPGWVEHDPIEILDRTHELLDRAVSDAQAAGVDVQAAGITNQRETTIVWNRHTGRPLYNAIVWQDTRTQNLCDQLSARGLAPRIRAKTGLPI